MTAELETTVRGPQAYAFAHHVIDEMEKAGVWPTRLNFELWLHYLDDRESPLACEIDRLLAPIRPRRTMATPWRMRPTLLKPPAPPRR